MIGIDRYSNLFLNAYINRHAHTEYLKIFEVYSSCDIQHVFLYSIYTNIYHIGSMKYRQYAYIPANRRIHLPMWIQGTEAQDEVHGGSVVECLTGDGGVVGSSLTGGAALCPLARHFINFNPGRPVMTWLKNCWLGRKELKQIKRSRSCILATYIETGDKSILTLCNLMESSFWFDTIKLG